MPRKPTAKAIKAAVAKHNPQRVHVIQDACATKGCYAAPVKGSGFCEEHIMGPGRQPETNSSKVKDQLAALIAGTPSLKKASVKPPSQPEPTSTPEAVKLIETLRKAGWSDAEIGFGVGIKATGTLPRDTVWKWRKAKASCPKVPELRALLDLDAPSKTPKKKAAKEPVVKGSLKAPSTATQSPRVNAKLDDPRQLRLALEGLVDTLSALLS